MVLPRSTAVLADKVRSLGVQKGILISTSGFQRGAYEYAKAHGIALLQILDKRVMHILNAYLPGKEERKRKVTLMQEWMRRMPQYYTYEYSEMDFPDKMIYPSKSDVAKIREQFEKDFILSE